MHIRAPSIKSLLAALFLTAIAAIGAGAEQRPTERVAPAEPAEYRAGDYRSPTPLTLRGATVISSAEAMALWKANGALFNDVMPRPRKPDNLPPQTLWHIPEHLNIPGSAWLPNTGNGGLAPAAAAYFQERLQRLTAKYRRMPPPSPGDCVAALSYQGRGLKKEDAASLPSPLAGGLPPQAGG